MLFRILLAMLVLIAAGVIVSALGDTPESESRVLAVIVGGLVLAWLVLRFKHRRDARRFKEEGSNVRGDDAERA